MKAVNIKVCNLDLGCIGFIRLEVGTPVELEFTYVGIPGPEGENLFKVKGLIDKKSTDDILYIDSNSIITIIPKIANILELKVDVNYNYVDDILDKDLRTILDEGLSTVGTKVRPVWASDGAPAHTKSLFGVMNRYDISKGLPLSSKRPTPFTKAIDEILWIWQKKSNNVNELGSKIWDQWADPDGSIGKCYGHTMGIKFTDKNGNEVDQVDWVLNQIIAHSGDRGIMTELYIHKDLPEMNLRPCVHHTQWAVRGGKLHVLVKQRSQDTVVANNWNVVQYAALLMMFAQVAGLECGELIHVIGDMHIYDRHEEIAEEIIERESYPLATTKLDPTVKNFYDFKVEHFTVENYKTGKQIKNIPVAK